MNNLTILFIFFFVLCLIIIFGLLMYLIYLPKKNIFNSSSYNNQYDMDKYDPGYLHSNANFVYHGDDKKRNDIGFDGSEWNDVIKNSDLHGTGIQETHSDFVKKISEKPFTSTAARNQLLDHDRDHITYMGFRRYNYKGTASNLPGDPRQVPSERLSDYTPRPSINLVTPHYTEFKEYQKTYYPFEA